MSSITSKGLLSKTTLDRVYRLISIKFGVTLSQQQLLILIDRQPEDLRKALQSGQVAIETLDLLVETVSEKITGIRYPTQQSTLYYKEYFKRKLNDNKDKYFGA